jgi:G3E family GTPase
MQNGCICCTLREDLLLEIGKLAKERRFDYLLIESTGISEPLPVAETFTFESEPGKSLDQFASLDTMVTVVDAKSFLADWQSEDNLIDRKLAISDEDERSISDLLVEQIEFANVLVLTKLDLVSQEDGKQLVEILHHLNPDASVLFSDHGRVPLHALLGTGLFDFEKAAQAPGWMKAVRGESVPETTEYGISSFVYRARVPFHPRRFWDLLQNPDTWQGVLRSKGFFWLASRMNVTGLWSHAGGSASCEAAGTWYAALPKHEWPDDEEFRATIMNDWKEPWGDRRQELVFIGAALDEEVLRARLDAALLSPDEFQDGPIRWQTFNDPFPVWSDEPIV